jgi:hypothetical protein
MDIGKKHNGYCQICITDIQQGRRWPGEGRFIGAAAARGMAQPGIALHAL